MSFSVISGTLASDVAASSGTFTSSYPSGKNAGTFYKATGHKLVVGQNNAYNFPKDFDITLGASTITITNKTTTIWTAGSTFRLQVEEQGERQYRGTNGQLLAGVLKVSDVLINLGAPAAASANAISTSQTVTFATTPLATITGALASGGVATLDVPRNVVAAWTGTAVVTVTGTDVYGKSLSEASASGTSLAGKKAFKTVTSVSFSANVSAATVGTGDVLGLPVFLSETTFVLKELESGAVPTAGTLVAGIITAGGSTTTTGDVRGTYDPNSACDGALVFQLIAALPDPTSTGALKQNLDTSTNPA